jgi:hypothetical protein
MLIAAASALGQTALLEKKNLADWDFYVVKEGVKVEDVFSFASDGRLLCTGLPFGYLATKETYKNFKLSLEWCWTQGKEPTNSGIFLKITDQPKGAFLPKAVEVQLQHKNAGDVWAFYGRTITDSSDRFSSAESADIGKFMGVKKISDAEKAPGQWNAMEILCVDGLIVVVVNGKIVNWTAGAEAIEGRIGFQSEGGPIEFRNVVLTTLP